MAARSPPQIQWVVPGKEVTGRSDTPKQPLKLPHDGKGQKGEAVKEMTVSWEAPSFYQAPRPE